MTFKVPQDGYSRGAEIPQPAEVVDMQWAAIDYASGRIGKRGIEARVVDIDGAVTYVPVSGRPQGWSEQAPDPKPLPRTETRVTRSRKGRTSYRATSRYPVAKRPIGSVDGVPVVLCDDERHVRGCQCETRSLNEAELLAMAERWVAERDPNGAPLPRVIGYAVTRPEMLPGDRSTAGATSDDLDDEDVYIDERTARQRALTDALTRRGNERCTGGRYVRETDAQGVKRRVWQPSYDSIDVDAPIPHRASLCAVSHDDMASFLGIDPTTFLGWFRDAPSRSSDTSIADRHRRRTTIPRNGRLGKVARRKADVAVLRESTDPLAPRDERGRPYQLLGRRTATAVELVTFADAGYWLGHRYIAPTTATDRAAVVAATERALTIRDALRTIRDMAVGETLGDRETVQVTRETAGRWRIGPATYDAPAQAARALLHAAS